MKQKRIAIVLPAFRENESIENLIINIRKVFPLDTYLVVVDDSPDDLTVLSCLRAFKACGWQENHWNIIKNYKKCGRGGAVKMGLQFLLENTESDCFLEMDSDGSHPPHMALKVANEVPKYDFCVGSRYLPGSRIYGWSFQRRLFSKIINGLLSFLFGNYLSDWTNGLRAYSLSAVQTMCQQNSISSRFIYLCEQAVILSRRGYTIKQVPVEFKNRLAGKSTVTFAELFASFFGMLKIYISRRNI